MTCLLCTAEFILQEFYICVLNMKVTYSGPFPRYEILETEVSLQFQEFRVRLAFWRICIWLRKVCKQHHQFFFLLVSRVKTLMMHCSRIVFWRYVMLGYSSLLVKQGNAVWQNVYRRIMILFISGSSHIAYANPLVETVVLNPSLSLSCIIGLMLFHLRSTGKPTHKSGGGGLKLK